MYPVLLGRHIKGIAFDFEGTSVDVEEAHWRGHLQVLKEFAGIRIELKQENWEEILRHIPSFIGGPRSNIVKEIHGLQGDPSVTIEEIEELDRQLYHVYLKQIDIKMRPGFEAWVHYVKNELGLPTVVGTATPRNEAQFILKESGLINLFPYKTIAFGEDYGARNKPHGDIYIATAEMIGIDPYNQLVMGDSHTSDLPAAREAGALFFGTPTVDDRGVLLRFESDITVGVSPDWRELKLFGFNYSEYSEFLRELQEGKKHTGLERLL